MLVLLLLLSGNCSRPLVFRRFSPRLPVTCCALLVMCTLSPVGVLVSLLILINPLKLSKAVLTRVTSYLLQMCCPRRSRNGRVVARLRSLVVASWYGFYG